MLGGFGSKEYIFSTAKKKNPNNFKVVHLLNLHMSKKLSVYKRNRKRAYRSKKISRNMKDVYTFQRTKKNAKRGERERERERERNHCIMRDKNRIVCENIKQFT